MGTLLGEVILTNKNFLLISLGASFKETEKQIHSTVVLILASFVIQRSKQEVSTVFSFCGNAGKHEGVTIHLNPIAHRMAKTPQSFGHSAWNRVNQ